MNPFLLKSKLDTPRGQASGPASRKLSFEDDVPLNDSTAETTGPSFANLFLSKEKKYQSESSIFGLNKKVSTDLSSVSGSPFRETQLKSYLNYCPVMKKETSMHPLMMLKTGSNQSIPSSTDISETRESTVNEQPNALISLFGKLSLASCNVVDGRAHGSFSEPCDRIVFNQERRAAGSTDLNKEHGKSLSLSLNKNNRDPDLNTISQQTMAKILREYQPHEYLVIDCRYPYEYNGGHIQGAINVVSPDMLETIFFRNTDILTNKEYLIDLKKDPKAAIANVEMYRKTEEQKDKTESKPLFIIFHCEFSQKRGPRAFRELRNKDRNINVWPKLSFPEIYVLEGGYCNFYEQFPELCDGDYIDMVHKKYKSEYAQAKDMDKQFWGKKDLISISLDKDI